MKSSKISNWWIGGVIFWAQVTNASGVNFTPSSKAEHSQAIPQVVVPPGSIPTVTFDCVKYDEFHSCQVQERLLTLHGVACREECLVFSHFGDCELANKCHYNYYTGCFVKTKCSKLDSFKSCAEWSTENICK